MLHRFAPALAMSAVQSIDGPAVTPSDIRRRLAYARHVFEADDLFVAPSASLAREFAELGLSNERIDVSDYGFRPASNWATAGPRDDGPLRVGFVGTLVWHKGAHVLLEAVQGLRGAFDVVIHGDTNVFPEYVATLRKSAVGAPITFAGGFDRDRIEDVYRTFDVLVVSSLWPENSPLVIHEAFMRGVPVVGARVGGIPELVQDGINGLLYEPFSAASLRSSLQRLVDDRRLVTSLAGQLPGVKSIQDDASEWRQRYRAVCSRATTNRPVQA
jgi:glycosyltransferase involved in cell wall biosynthesis